MEIKEFTYRAVSLLKKRRFAYALIACLLIILFLGFIPFSLPIVKQTIAKRVSEVTGGDTLSIQELTFTLWQGFSLRDVRYVTFGRKKPAVHMQISRIRVSYRMVTLLWGKFVLNQIILQNPDINVDLPRPKKPGAAQPGTSVFLPISLLFGTISLNLPVKLEVKNLSVEKARFEIKKSGAPFIRGKGLSLNLKASIAGKVQAEGVLKLDSLWAPEPYLFTSLHTELFLNENTARLSNASFKFCRGRGEIDLAINTAGDTLLAADFSMKKLDLARLMRLVNFKKGRLSGFASVGMSIHGPDSDPKHLRGRGSFSVRNFTATGLPLQKTLSRLLLLRKLDKLNFSKISASLNLSRGRLRIPDLRGVGNICDLTGSGWVNLNTYADQKIEISFSPELCSRLPRAVSQGMLFPGRQGRCNLKARLHGPLSNLKIEIDKKNKERAAKTIIQGVGKALHHFFKGR